MARPLKPTKLLPRIPSHAALLLVLLVLIVVVPILPTDESAFIFELLFDLVLLTGVYSVGPGRHRWPFLVLTVLTLGIRWGEELTGTGTLDVSALAITVFWLAYAISIIVGHLFRRKEVTLNTIFGAVVTYLLIAVAFALIFEITETMRPGSFSGLPETTGSDRNTMSSAMMYFSLVCLTTMGYGDIVPATPIARPLAVLEGVFGQLYLAVMIARLVGLHIAIESRRDD